MSSTRIGTPETTTSSVEGDRLTLCLTRREMQQAGSDPGSYAGYKRDRSMGEWIADALIAASASQYAVEAGQGHLQLGQQVEVNPAYQYAADWARQRLWIAGMQVAPKTGAVTYWTSDQWPPASNGDLCTDWKPEDLLPTAGRGLREALEGLAERFESREAEWSALAPDLRAADLMRGHRGGKAMAFREAAVEVRRALAAPSPGEPTDG